MKKVKGYNEIKISYTVYDYPFRFYIRQDDYNVQNIEQLITLITLLQKPLKEQITKINKETYKYKINFKEMKIEITDSETLINKNVDKRFLDLSGNFNNDKKIISDLISELSGKQNEIIETVNDLTKDVNGTKTIII